MPYDIFGTLSLFLRLSREKQFPPVDFVVFLSKPSRALSSFSGDALIPKS